jgi:hypothetical protein
VIDGWHSQAVEGQAQSVSKAFTGSMAKAVAAVRLKAPYPSKGTKRCLSQDGAAGSLSPRNKWQMCPDVATCFGDGYVNAMLGTRAPRQRAGDGPGQAAWPLASEREDNHDRIRPQYESPVTGRPFTREPAWAASCCQACSGTSATFRIGSAHRVTESTRQSSWCRTFLDKVDWPADPGRRQNGAAGQCDHHQFGKHCRAARCPAMV